MDNGLPIRPGNEQPLIPAVWDRRKFLTYTAIAVGAPLVVSACGGSNSGGAGAPSSPGGVTSSSPSAGIDLDAAKREGAITFYSTTTESASQGLADGFKKKYGIAAAYYHANSTPMAQRIVAEEKSNQVGGDVLIMDTPLMPTLVKYLAAWDPPERASIPAKYKTPQSTRIRLYVAAIAWNTQLVTSNPPKTWEDLADPKWKGKLSLVNANQTVIGVQLFEMLKTTYGDDYLKRLAANKPRVDQTGIAISQELGAGSVAVGSTYDYALFTTNNVPVAGVIPPLTILTGSDCGIFKATKKTNAARLFYNYACSAEGQVALNAAGHSIATNPAAVVPQAHTLADIGKVFPTDFATLPQRSADLLAEFNSLFG